MRSRMTRISASRFGAHTSCIRDMEVGGGGGWLYVFTQWRRAAAALDKGSGEDGGTNRSRVSSSSGHHLSLLFAIPTWRVPNRVSTLFRGSYGGATSSMISKNAAYPVESLDQFFPFVTGGTSPDGVWSSRPISARQRDIVLVLRVCEALGIGTRYGHGRARYNGGFHGWR